MRIPRLVIVLLLALGSSSASAAPFIFYRGILNAASYVPAGLPNGSIARGSIFSIFGRDLGPAEGKTVSSFPLGAAFEGVSIEVCQGGVCVQALPLFVLNTQINAIMPSNAPLGKVAVRVTFNGEAGNFSPATVVASSFGTFAINSGGFGPGVVQNFTPTGLPVNSSLAAVAPGQTVIVWGTGLGAGLSADNVAPQAGDLPAPVEIWAGGKPVTVKRYSGRSPCCSGVDQVIFDLPPDTPTGCYVPVTIRAGGVVSNDTTMSISTNGQACSDPDEPTSAALRQGGKLGAAVVVRDRRRRPSGGSVIADIAYATFTEESGGPWAYHPDYASPPPGSCVVSARRGALYEMSAVYGGAPSVRSLDAGERLSLVTGAGERGIPRRLGPHPGYLGYMGPLETDFDPASVLLNASGAVRLTSAGGADVGGFNVTLQMPNSPAWNLAQTTIDRNQPLTLSWNGAGENDQVWVTGGTSDPAHDAAVVFSCHVGAGQNSFTIGSEVLGRLPATLPVLARMEGFLSIAARRPSALSIDSLNGGTVSAVSGASTSVEYQ